MKKILSLLIAVLMIVGMLASCGGSDEPALDGTDKADVNQPAGDDGATDAKETKVYKVNLHIRASADAADKYVAEDYEFAKNNGMLTCILVPDKAEHYKDALDMGCTMFTSDDPAKAIEILKALGVR